MAIEDSTRMYYVCLCVFVFEIIGICKCVYVYLFVYICVLVCICILNNKVLIIYIIYDKVYFVLIIDVNVVEL